jgi:hypothetical protein
VLIQALNKKVQFGFECLEKINEEKTMKRMNVKNLVTGLFRAVLCLGFTAVAMADSPRVSRMSFNQDMRKLWEDHITYTRLYIVDTLADLPAKEATANRLLANQADIGKLMEPYYGKEAANKLTNLLKDHIRIAAEVVEVAKKGDSTKQKEASKRWYANSDDIAVFLEDINPDNWPAKDMKKMLREHLATTTEEVTDGLKKNWTADIADYDRLNEQILKMADVLSIGVIKQFPDKFKK